MFKYDNKVNRIMTVVFDFLILNAIFLIMSIPIITIGANVTALYSVGFQMVRKDESSVYKTYFRSFKENFKQATAAWCFLLSIILILFWNMTILDQTTGISPIVNIMTVLFLVLTLIFLLYIFPIISKFENSLYVQAKNVLLLSIGYFPYTILFTLINLGPIFIAYRWYPAQYLLVVYGYFFIGFALTIILNARIFNRIFNNMLKTNEHMGPELE